MRTSPIHAAVLLVLWQTAPIPVAVDSAGRLQFSLGYGLGQFEERQLSCEGDVLSASPHEFRTVGAKLDAWATPSVRVTGFGGAYREDGAGTGYGGIQMALEGRGLGVGLGVVRSPFVDVGPTMPSVYLRLGSRDGAHFRGDFLSPTPILGTSGDVLRLGVGFNAGRRRGASGFFGYSAGPYTDESHIGGVFGELSVPLAKPVDLWVAGSFRPAAEYGDYGVGGGVRLHLRP